MFVHVPAMRGKMGTRTCTYYACLMPLSAVPNLFKFTDWAGFTPEDREQRVLNVKRVPESRPLRQILQAIAQAARTSILRGRTSGRLGMRSVSTPSLKVASTLSVSSSLLKANVLW